MGDHAELILSGAVCEQCGEPFAEASGYARSCRECRGSESGGGYWPQKPKNTAYVVWKGRTPGVYGSWPEAQAQVHGFQGARFKGYRSRTAADDAWARGFDAYEERRVGRWAPGKAPQPPATPEPLPKARGPYNPAVVKERARLLTTGFKGSHTVTCTDTACNYPNCLCLGN